MQALNAAYMKVTSGTFSYQEAIRQAVRDAAVKGTSVMYDSGYISKLDTAIRTALLTGVNQTAGKLTELYASELGAEYYETTAHAGARPSHSVWQGKVFKIEGTALGMRTSTRQPDMEQEPVCVVGIADIASIRTGRGFQNLHTRKMIWRITADLSIRLQGIFSRSMSVCRNSVNMNGQSENIRESWLPMIRISRQFSQKPIERTSERSFRKNL